MAVEKTPVSEVRRQRFADLLAHSEFAGKKAALGEALGWKGGDYVSQILDGRRPITEKLITKIETMLGGKFAGWFSSGQSNSSDRELLTMDVSHA